MTIEREIHGPDVTRLADIVARDLQRRDALPKYPIGSPTLEVRKDVRAAYGQLVRVSESDVTVSLPRIAGTVDVGRAVGVMSIGDDVSGLSVDPAGTDTIDGSTSYGVSGGRLTRWFVVAASGLWTVVAGSVPVNAVVAIDKAAPVSASSSGTFVDISTISASVTVPEAGTYMVHFSGSAFNLIAGGTIIRYRVDVGGAQTADVGAWNAQHNSSGHRVHKYATELVALSSGSQTAKVQWRRSAGSGSMNTNAADYFRVELTGPYGV